MAIKKVWSGALKAIGIFVGIVGMMGATVGAIQTNEPIYTAAGVVNLIAGCAAIFLLTQKK